MALTNRSTLKGYFNTGDRPTQQNFYDLIESSLTVPAYANIVAITGDATLTAASHAFRPLAVTGTTVLTLPAVAVGHSYWIINANDDGTAITISPNANDLFIFDAAGAAGTDNKDIINTAGTALKGDFAKITYGAAAGWLILELGGIWADEA